MVLLVNLVIFGLLFCILFKYCFTTVRTGSKITVFCLREFGLVIDCLRHVLSRVRSGNLFSASLRACEIACSAPPSSAMAQTFALDWSTRMNKLQSGPPKHGQILTMAEIKLRAFFSPQQTRRFLYNMNDSSCCHS